MPGNDLRDLTDRALNVAQLHGATYADIRTVRRTNQTLVVKNGIVEAVELIGGTLRIGIRDLAPVKPAEFVVFRISQFADGEEPHRPGGCPAQATSVAELLRTLVWDLGL